MNQNHVKMSWCFFASMDEASAIFPTVMVLFHELTIETSSLKYIFCINQEDWCA
jgi:hypothetical protein